MNNGDNPENPDSREKAIRQLRKIIFAGLFLQCLTALGPIAKEMRFIARDLPALWGTTNEERRVAMFGGLLDSVEDHEFIARCKKAIPPGAEVLIISNSMGNVYTLNYYLYPRKTSVDASALGENYWIVRYFTPKALGMNKIEEPHKNGAVD